jgi:thymidylate synthase
VVQFYVKNGFLDMSCYNRSQDLALGTPFNIASHSLLLIIMAGLAGLRPRYLHVTLGVAHIYNDHVEDMRTLVHRQPHAPPTLRIKKEISTLDDVCALEYEDFELSGYEYHPAIKMKMVA